MKITPTTLTLQQFFSASNEQFLIPAYQRRYAWGEKQQRELFDDIRLLPPGETHLLGTVLFLTSDHSAGINQMELVDGQQRITSLSILLAVLARRFEAKSDVDAARELRKLLECKSFDRKVQLKLMLGDLDHVDFLRLMESGDLSEMENDRLLAAHDFFTDWVAALSLDELYRFDEKLRNLTTIIRLDVGAAKDAYKLFETINNRGLRLIPTDIIKNFLLGHASSLPQGTFEKVKENWRKLIVALDGLDSDDFFRQWLAGKLHRKVTTGLLVVDFKAYYLRLVQEAAGLIISSNISEEDESDEQEDVAVIDAIEQSAEHKVKKIKLVSFALSLRQAAEQYSKLLWANTSTPKIDRHLANLIRIKAFQTYTLLLDMFQRDVDDKTKIRILKSLEAFMMRRHICEKRSNELETIFSGLTGIADDGYEKAVLTTLREHTPDDEEFEAAFTTFPFVPAVISRARYALEMFEYDTIVSKNEYYLADPDDLELEHIIPKAADKTGTKAVFGDWPKYLGDGWKVKHTKMLHRIGNMALLADELNVVASNNPFHAKRDEYAKSNIRLTNSLATYQQFKFKTVEERSAAFAQQAVRIWKV